MGNSIEDENCFALCFCCGILSYSKCDDSHKLQVNENTAECLELMELIETSEGTGPGNQLQP